MEAIQVEATTAASIALLRDAMTTTQASVARRVTHVPTP